MAAAKNIRNLAIIAHIDHGKTTLIDSIFQAAHVFRENQEVAERVMDNYDLERERGITIRSKHCTVFYNECQINIIDTPGHADFSGEVERVLSMVDSVLLLVDANEGPMPQTRYVLMRALAMGLTPVVIINKVDRPNARPDHALDMTFDLFHELGASDEQCDFPVLYGSGLAGWLVRDLDKDAHEGMEALFETVIEEVPPPNVDAGKPFLMQISTLEWSDYIGQIGCGKVLQGSLKKGDPFLRTVTRWKQKDDRGAGWEVVGSSPEKGVHMWETRGLKKEEVNEILAGDIVWLAGPDAIGIGDTFSAVEMENPALQPLEIEEPTVSMFFLVNNGPFAGQEGNAVTLRQIKDRLERELRTNVALRMDDIGRGDGVKVSGRGELHLGILIEEMRREGIEMCVSRPEVITHTDKKGKLLEPVELLIINVPEEYQGVVIEKLARRKGELLTMENSGTGMIRMEFSIPMRGLIGYRNEFLTDTRGLGILASRFTGYERWKGEVASRSRGSLISMDQGSATSYQIENLQERAKLFVEPMEKVYAGQVVGENSRPKDLPCNPTKKKALTNHRASNKDIATALKARHRMSLDAALEWIADDELVEVTPKSVRIRKAVLGAEERKRIQRQRDALAS
jgi:GTP-binding protein